MKKAESNEIRISSSSFKSNQHQLNTNEIVQLDDEIYFDHYCKNLDNLDTENNSLESFGICKKTEFDEQSRNSSFFDDIDAIKINDPNQIVDLFTSRVQIIDDQQLRQNFQNQKNEKPSDEQINENSIQKVELQIPQKQEQKKPKYVKTLLKIKKVRKKKLTYLKKKQQKIKNKINSKFNFESLALRNIKTNFASGLIQFIQFKYELLNFDETHKQELYKSITKYLYLKLPALRSFSGWREIWKDSIYGYKIRQLSLLFFSKFFIYDYINGSRVKEEYKKEYIRKIPKFIQGCLNYHLFNSYNFNL